MYTLIPKIIPRFRSSSLLTVIAFPRVCSFSKQAVACVIAVLHGYLNLLLAHKFLQRESIDAAIFRFASPSPSPSPYTCTIPSAQTSTKTALPNDLPKNRGKEA
jgi:hypothetical protein